MASFFDGKDLQRAEYLYLAKLAEKGGRYDEVIYFMKRLVYSTEKIQLTHEEMNLLSMAHKHVVESLRVARRAFAGSGNDSHLSLFNTYKSGVDSELNEQCNSIILLLKSLLNSPNPLEAKVVYWRMIGDQYRYLAEFNLGAERQAAVNKALSSYKKATVIADRNLLRSNPMRLELALNVSVFYYEVLGNFEEALAIAKEAHEEAADRLKATLGKGPYEESSTTVLMKSLRDNIKAWEAQAPEEVQGRSWRPHFFTTSNSDNIPL